MMLVFLNIFQNFIYVHFMTRAGCILSNNGKKEWFCKKIFNIFFQQKSSNMYKYNTLMSIILIINHFFHQWSFSRNYWTLLTTGEFFGKRNTNFKETNLKDWRTLLFLFFSERRIWDPVQRLRWNLFAKIVNNFKSINIFAKSFVSDAWQGPLCAYVCGNWIPLWLS